MKSKKMSKQNMDKVWDIIKEIITNNDELRTYIENLGSDKWSEFAKDSGAYRYKEEFDNADFEEHFHYSPEEANLEAWGGFISDVSEKVVIMIEAYLKTLISN